jgi:hypothetical protein
MTMELVLDIHCIERVFAALPVFYIFCPLGSSELEAVLYSIHNM